MDQPTNSPSNKELLERIIKLEAENARLIACVFDLREAQNVLMASIEDSFTHVNDLLWPLVEKAFPQYREMKNRLDAIIPPCFVDPRVDRRRD
jgi:Zn-dependent oligopeptidase